MSFFLDKVFSSQVKQFFIAVKRTTHIQGKVLGFKVSPNFLETFLIMSDGLVSLEYESAYNPILLNRPLTSKYMLAIG